MILVSNYSFPFLYTENDAKALSVLSNSYGPDTHDANFHTGDNTQGRSMDAAVRF